jgi:hypothetical protein
MLRRLLVLAFLAFALGLFLNGRPAAAQGPTWQVTGVLATGCANRQFRLNTERIGFPAETSLFRTIVQIDGLIYMHELATVNTDAAPDVDDWRLFNLFTAGPVPNPGTWPMPADRPMTLDLTYEKPFGTIVYAWQVVIDGCNTGNIVYSGPPLTPPPIGPSVRPCIIIPPGAVVGDMPFPTQAYYEPGNISPGVILNPGTYTVVGQDETETYYRIALSCDWVWVRKEAMQPSYQPPQNGQALPTDIVGAPAADAPTAGAGGN